MFELCIDACAFIVQCSSVGALDFRVTRHLHFLALTTTNVRDKSPFYFTNL